MIFIFLSFDHNLFKIFDHFLNSMGSFLFSPQNPSACFYNPSIRDQAIKQGYFPRISVADLSNPLFLKYDIVLNKIASDKEVFEGPLISNKPYTNEEFNDTVCKISFSAKCKLVPDTKNEFAYDLVDASYREPKKLITVFIENDPNIKERYSLEYIVHNNL